MSEKLRWLSNTGGREYVSRMPGETLLEAIESYDRWIAGKIIGRPQATATYTVEQLEAMGMFGVYISEPEG